MIENMEIDNSQIRFLADRAFLFGHYDSRGGAMLLVAETLVEACLAYNCEFEGEVYPAKTEFDAATEDFMEMAKLWVFGPWDPEDNTDLIGNGEVQWRIERIGSFSGGAYTNDKKLFGHLYEDTGHFLLIPEIFPENPTGPEDEEPRIEYKEEAKERPHPKGMLWWKANTPNYTEFLTTWGFGFNLGEDAYGCYFIKVPEKQGIFKDEQ